MMGGPQFRGSPEPEAFALSNSATDDSHKQRQPQ